MQNSTILSQTAASALQIYPWQNAQWEYLLRRFDNNNVPHALLLAGSDGLGKFNFASAFAAFLLCQRATSFQNLGADSKQAVCEQSLQKQPLQNACGVCSACLLLQAGNHPDLFVITPEDKNKPLIKVDQIRALIADLSQTSQQGGYKIALINVAEAMNIAAANALLKTLEEPAPNVIIILVSAHLHAMPATILSRCQKLFFHAPARDIAVQWLKQTMEKRGGEVASSINPEVLLNLSNNAPLKALALMDADILAARDQIFVMLEALYAGQLNVVAFAEKHNGFDINLLLDNFLSIVNDLIKIKFKSTHTALIHHDKIALLNNFASKSSVQDLYKYADELLHVRKMLEENINFNQQMLLESLCLSWPL